MKPWILAVGTLAIVTVALWREWRRRLLAREITEATYIRSLIKPLDQRFAGHDDKLRIKSTIRREHADDIRREAARIESGQPEERIKLMGRWPA
jgi:hypothetical protein